MASDSIEVPGDLFSGYDSINGVCKATAIDGAIHKPIDDSQTSVHIEVCSTAQEVASALSITGTAKASYGAFSATVASSYARELALTETSMVVVVSVVRKTTVERFKTAALQVEAPTSKTIEDFYQSNGDVWVSSLTKGMQYFSLFVGNSRTVEERTDLALSLKSEGGVGDFTGSVDVDSSLSTTLKNSAYSWSHSARGVGLSKGPMPSDIEGVLAFARNFSALSDESAAVLSFTTQGYDQVTGFPDALVKQLAKSRNLLSNPTRPTVESVESQRLSLQDQAHRIAEVDDIYRAYGYTDPRLAEVARMVKDGLDRLTTVEADIKDDPFGKWTLPDTPSLKFGAPEVQIKLDDTRPSVGGNGGSGFNGPTYQAVLDKKACLRTLTPRGDGATLSHLGMVYEGNGGQVQLAQYRGGDSVSLQLSARNRINYFEIAWDGGLVRGMTVRTTDGQVTSAGNGRGYALTPYPLADNERLVGFAGRAGEYVDRLQPVLAVFNPARWPEEVSQ